MTPELEEFARVLAQQVRDAVIQSCDRRLQLNAGGPIAKRWQEAVTSSTPEALAKMLIPDIVDDTMFYLLQAIDQGHLKVSFSASNGKIVDLSTEGLGELSGWYMGRGWRDVYSKERFVDVLSDP
jgi:hypothetical protein